MSDPLPSSDPVELLSGISLFADLSRPQLEAVAHSFEEEWIEAGRRVLRAGFAGNSVYVIAEGEASVEIEGREVNRLARGDFFGEVSVLLGEKPFADVTALTPLRCLVLPGGQLQGFLLSYPAVAYRMLQAEARRLRRTTLGPE